MIIIFSNGVGGNKSNRINKLPNIDIHSSSGNITAGNVSNHLIITSIATNDVSASNKNSIHSVITKIIIVIDLKS